MANKPDPTRMVQAAAEVVSAPGTAPLAASEFNDFSALIYRMSGITLGDSKKQLVASRLARRLRVHGMTSYRDYYVLVTQRDPSGDEMREMLNVITTNKTDFYRERHHFDFMVQRLFPECIERARVTGDKRLRIWSAGCSSGEEPYTIAMTLLGQFPSPSGWTFEIHATDLDTQVLANAERGVYSEDVVRPVPAEFQKRYFRRGTGANAGMVRATDELRRLITFGQLNFVAPSWPVEGPFDLIFCRNVMIYFDGETQRTIERRFAELLRPDGYLFLGHSETMQGLQDLFEPLRGTVHRRRGPGEAPGQASLPTPALDAARSTSPERPALAPAAVVDDSAGTSGPKDTTARRPRGGDGRDLPKVNIIIGGVRASAQPAMLRTVLGSCVCACIHDPVARIGGINHFMLPDGLEDRALPTRFGVNAMEVLINEVLKLGGDRRRLQAKAFGAAHVLSASGLNPDVPRKNAKFVKEFLANEGIPLMSSRLGGSMPVEVVFITDTGKALVRALGEAVARDLVREETRHDLEIRKTLVAPAMDAFELFGD